MYVCECVGLGAGARGLGQAPARSLLLWTFHPQGGRGAMAATAVVIESQILPLCHPGGSRGGGASSWPGNGSPRTPHAEPSGFLG